MAPFLLFVVLLPAFPAFWLGKNSEGGPVSSTIVGLFDTVRTLTKGVGGIVDQVEEGFDEIRNDEEEGESDQGGTRTFGQAETYDSCELCFKQIST